MIPPTLSLVIPCYRRFMDFCTASEHDALMWSGDCEVVASLDEPLEENLFVQYAKHNAQRMRLRILVRDEVHGWEPPCRALNAGVMYSASPFCLIKSPETMVLNDAETVLRMLDGQGRKRFFLTGDCVQLMPENFRTGDITKELYDGVPFGMPVNSERKGNGLLIARRHDLIQIGGYDESRKRYGADDDCIRERLKAFGCEHVHEATLRAAHIWRDTRPKHDPNDYEPLRSLHEVGKQTWNQNAVRVAYDWARV